MNTLMNHDYVGRQITLRSQAEEMYAELEPLLDQDPHYWLQRGSWELERGEIGRAENFLSQARGIRPDDFMIETEWAYLLMERACRDPLAEEAPEWFEEALGILFDIIDVRGSSSPNTYVVLAEHVLQWMQRSNLTNHQRRVLF